MSKEKLSIRLSNETIDALDNLMVSDTCMSRTSKFEHLITMSANCYNKAGNSVVGYFKFLEVAYMCQAFNGTMVDYKIMPLKEMLITTIQEFYAFGSIGFFSEKEVDVSKLLAKIEALDDYQALFVVNSIISFWKSRLKEQGSKIEDLPIVDKKNLN